MDEIWKDIVGYEGLYQVSNMGRVRSKERIFESKGTGRYKRNAQILSLGKHSKGYLTVTLFKNGKYKRFLIHRLVAKSFLPRDPKEGDGDLITRTQSFIRQKAGHDKSKFKEAAIEIALLQKSPASQVWFMGCGQLLIEELEV